MEEIRRFHPPLPAPVHPPGKVEIVILTPEVAREWNEEIKEGKRAPYIIFGTNEQDYLTLSQYWQEVLRYIRQLRAVVDFYREEKDRPQPAK